jgi:hypothetical protein
MKNSTLMKLLECLHIRDYNLLVEEHGFKMDFSQVGSQNSQNSIGKISEKKSKVSSYLMLVILFLFTNFLFAQQQPACNLRGVLESKRLRDGGQNFTINSDVIRSVPGTIYRWEFKSNNSQASFVTQNGQPNMTINPGNKNGEFNIKLTVINPPETRGASKTCSCTKSVSIGNVN